jgi:hypothetical protein
MVADRIVIGGEEVNFLLPRDTKRELTLESGRTWVGFDIEADWCPERIRDRLYAPISRRATWLL